MCTLRLRVDPGRMDPGRCSQREVEEAKQLSQGKRARFDSSFYIVYAERGGVN